MKKYGLFAAAMLAVLLAGCGSRKYQPVAVTAQTTEAAIQIEKPAGETVLILETEAVGESAPSDRGVSAGPGTDAAAGSGAGGPGVNGPGASAGNAVPETQAEPASKDITMMFSGDVLLSDHVLEAYRKGGGLSGVLDQGFRSAISGADLFFVNEEFPFSSRGEKAPDKQFTFRLPPEKVSIFKEIGIDGVTLANNHALDYGVDALLDTCEILDQAGIKHTGAGRSLDASKQEAVFEVNGRSIAVIGATRVMPVAEWAAKGNRAGMLSAYDPGELLAVIRGLRKKYDVVIACIHWGVERQELPQDYQKTMGRQMIDAGADLVVGSHPHVLQGIEFYKGKPIVYSLGNFIFGSSIPRTALLEAHFPEGSSTPEIRLIPGTSGAGYTHLLDSDKKRQEFFSYMKGISFGVEIEGDGRVRKK